MPRTHTITVYQYDELSDRAKQRAREWYARGTAEDPDLLDATVEDCARLLGVAGVELKTRPVKLMGGGTRHDPMIWYSVGGGQGDGASFDGTYAYRRGALRAIQTEAPAGEGPGYESNNELNRIVRELQDLQRRHFYRLSATVQSSGQCCADITAYAGDDEADSETQAALAELLRDLKDWVYDCLRREYEYQLSDEAIEESIRVNEYEFDEDGERV